MKFKARLTITGTLEFDTDWYDHDDPGKCIAEQLACWDGDGTAFESVLGADDYAETLVLVETEGE